MPPRTSKSETIVVDSSKKQRTSGFFLLILLLVVLSSLLIYFFLKDGAAFRNSPEWQAVFLSNGQVYFGKISKERSQYSTLREVYYLRVGGSPQPIQEGESAATNINLIKLGGELHGPEDEMRINRDHILFIEDLKPDSQLVQAITQLRNSGQ